MTKSLRPEGAATEHEPRFRSGAVARMVGMPVTTLRVWERRYNLGRAATTATGHRLYAAVDVERLALIKRLTTMGHAIGSIASLDLDALERVATTHATTRAQATGALEATASGAPTTWGETLPVTPRRYDDVTLSDFAGLSPTLTCECPRHVAEILMTLSHFEAYSHDCATRSPEDAALHAYLGRVAGAARGLFETAIERLAVHEGLVLKG